MSSSGSNRIPLQLIPFTFKLPEGFIVAKEELEPTQYTVLIRLPRTFRDKVTMTLSQIEIVVIQHTEDTITDEEQLRSTTEADLLARDATIMEDSIGLRHGVKSHECLYKQDRLYGYLVWFVLHGNAFIVQWYSTDGEVFRQYRPKVDEFIQSLRFND